MSLWKEFREFTTRGSVVDLAIGIMVGGAFAPIAKSLVDDIFMPPIGLLLGRVEPTHMKLIVFSDGSREAYNLLADPAEQHNLYSSTSELELLNDRLTKWIASMPRQDLRGKALDKETVERLKSLGYIQ